jgi:hypothetical protein
MKIGGYYFRKTSALTYRMAKEGDTYADGTPIPANYVVIVRVRDCEVVEQTETKLIINSDNTKPIADMTGHSYTNMVYGRWKEKVRNGKTYWQMTTYAVRDGQVYTTSIHRYFKPSNFNN